ncbi:MAG: PAS domain S-box protein [Anaerolineae bacterium]|nr:PAS domain S-box protein [Anaerolineae bacterium]
MEDYETEETLENVSLEPDGVEINETEKSLKRDVEQVKRDADRLVMLQEIGRAVSTQQDLPSVLESIYQQARQRLQIDSFYVSLYHPETHEISYPILYDEGKKYEKKTIAAYDEHFVVKIVRSGKPIWLQRTEDELVVPPGSIEMLGNESRKSASLMFIPLVTPEAIIGVISAQSYTVNAYDEDDLALLSGIGYHVAVAVENARLVTALRHELGERKRAEAKLLLAQLDLHVRETHLRTILDNMPLLIWLKDNNGRYLTVNQAMAEYGGYDSPQRLTGKIASEAFSCEPFIEQQSGSLDTIVGEQSDSAEGLVYHEKTNQWFETYKAPILDDDNAVLGTFGFARDVTERKKDEASLQESEARFRSVFEDSAIGMVLVRSDHSLVKVNQSFCQMLGYTEAELQNQYFKDITHPEDVQLSLDYHAALFAGKVSNYQFEKRYLHKQGHEVWTLLSVSIVKTNSDLPRYAIAQVEDIMERKQAEADRENLIHELEMRNTELERFAYTVSHDLKTPLITIGGFLGFLEIDARNGNLGDLDNDIQNIRRAVSKMRLLLDELLELSRVGRMMNKPKVVPFADIVQDALGLVHGRLAENHVQVTVQAGLPSVLVDEARLVEAVQNLVENAAKYMGEQAEPHIWIGVDDTNNRRVFTVRDNGMGIAPAHQEQIFGLFNKLDSEGEGTGIGLALVKRIIEVHNGRLWVESAGLGQGSTFCFTLNETGN